MSEAPPRQPSVGDNDDRTDRAAAVSHLVSPRSIAIVGASADLSKINGRPLKHLLDKGYAGRIYPINPKYPQIAGVTCYATVAALPEAPDMAVVALPAREVPDCIEALGERGVRAAVIFSSGFGEMGAEGLRLQEQLLERAHRHGVVLCGPNCLGLVNGFDSGLRHIQPVRRRRGEQRPDRVRHAVGRVRHRDCRAGARARPGAGLFHQHRQRGRSRVQ